MADAVTMSNTNKTVKTDPVEEIIIPTIIDKKK